MERLCCAFHTAHPRASVALKSQRFMFVNPPAHTKIFRILGEKRQNEVVDVTLWRSSPCSGFLVTRFFPRMSSPRQHCGVNVSFLLFLRLPMIGNWFQVEHVISTLLSVGRSDNILLNAFVSARLTRLGLTFRLEDVPIVNWDKFPLDVVRQSVDHGLWRAFGWRWLPQTMISKKTCPLLVHSSRTARFTSHIVSCWMESLRVMEFVVTKFASSNFHHALTRSHLWTSRL